MEKDRNIALEDLDLNMFVVTQVHVKDMLMFLGMCMLMFLGMCMRYSETGNRIRHISASHAIQVVDSVHRHFRNIITNTERGSGNVREVAPDLRTDVDVQPQAGLKRCTVSQNEIAFAMVVEATPAPAALLAGGSDRFP
jgi:hypothetical protein